MTGAPLKWPDGWKRTEKRKRQSAPFGGTFAKARDDLLREVDLLGGTYPLISTNIASRRDGLPHANAPEPDDTGVAVYFSLKGRQKVFACDRWILTKHNMRAIQKTIAALRGIERWGASELLERSFSAFEALPPPSAPKTWHDTFAGIKTFDDLAKRYREKAKTAHPDQGGSEAEMSELNRHYAEAKKALLSTAATTV